MPLHLVIDIGNSRTKCALFMGRRLLRTGVWANTDHGALRGFLAHVRMDRVVMASTAHADTAQQAALSALGPLTVVTGATPSPLTNTYSTPDGLGADRLANAVGAAALFAGRPVLAIDLGTCITYDLVDAQGTYLGGLISPGYRMRAKAMNLLTARLPEVEPPAHPPLIGRSTLECLASGVHHGTKAELQALIHEHRQQYPGLVVVLTGGDAPRFARALENGIFAHPYLTLLGLHEILLHLHPADGHGPAA
jgi:type III pantothenate kinase